MSDYFLDSTAYYYNTNINPECWIHCNASRPIDHIQPSITNMSISSHRVLTLLHTELYKLGI